MMKHNFSIGWVANAYLGMFMGFLAKAAANWTLDVSHFPDQTGEILGKHQSDAMLTRGDLADEHKVYSTALQDPDDNNAQIIDYAWNSASLNMFSRSEGESMLDLLGTKDGGGHGQTLMTLPTLEEKNIAIKAIASKVLDDYITRNYGAGLRGMASFFANRLRTRTDVLLERIAAEFWSARKRYGDTIRDQVLVIVAISPSIRLSQRACLTSSYGEIYKEDDRLSQDGSEWDTDEYSQALRNKIRLANEQRSFEELEKDEASPQLRFSPITPSDSAHAIAVPFYKTPEQREAWENLRDNLKMILTS
eukprot:TRINITY_DN37740_c0_g1_i1.p1 TRINITY_DN37740_c0_g1~~TRINITY_DN37740_c0_g1_i1.p1  ORF type:complete len:306 (+),score=30.01 TRINITY_DN37740_c0_g1_i1:520-1437(+)